MRIMKSRTFSLIAGCFLIFSCGREEKAAGPLSQPGTLPGSLEDSFSKDVLLGNRERFQSQIGDEIDPRKLAHDTPSMEKEARGPYSYQGAAREFKDICGIAMPDWVQPIEGEYSVGKISGKFVSQAHLLFKIDPMKIPELQHSILQAYPRRWPKALPLVPIQVPSDSNGISYWGIQYQIIENGQYLYNVSVALDSNGGIRISNTRGSTDWDQ